MKKKELDMMEGRINKDDQFIISTKKSVRIEDRERFKLDMDKFAKGEFRVLYVPRGWKVTVVKGNYKPRDGTKDGVPGDDIRGKKITDAIDKKGKEAME